MSKLFPTFCLATHLLAAPAMALELDLTGYGTVGYAISDRSFTYQRFIDDGGTFARDSVLGVQLDALLGPQWSATVQVKAAPATDHDSRWQPQVAWAFASWRPDNDWLLRAGRLRVPGLLYLQNLDVGVTFDFARLPMEVYSVSPVFDFDGALLNRSWESGHGTLALDAYWGRADVDWRVYFRDGVPGRIPQGAQFQQLEARSRGVALSWREHDNVYSVAWHQATVERTDGELWPDAPVWVPLAPGIGYYDVQPGPNVPSRRAMDLSIVNLGAELALPQNFRLTGEYARRRLAGMERGFNSDAAYLALSRRVGRWTPYLLHARLRSEDGVLDTWRMLDRNRVPAALPGAALINASQRAAADGMLGYDQYSSALGAAYTLSPAAKLKAEWLRTHIGTTSSLADAPSGNRDVDVVSLSYSFIF